MSTLSATLFLYAMKSCNFLILYRIIWKTLRTQMQITFHFEGKKCYASKCAYMEQRYRDTLLIKLLVKLISKLIFVCNQQAVLMNRSRWLSFLPLKSYEPHLVLQCHILWDLLPNCKPNCRKKLCELHRRISFSLDFCNIYPNRIKIQWKFALQISTSLGRRVLCGNPQSSSRIRFVGDGEIKTFSKCGAGLLREVQHSSLFVIGYYVWQPIISSRYVLAPGLTVVSFSYVRVRKDSGQVRS